MPRNNKNLVAKDIDGKKIREQYFDGLVIGALIGIVFYTIVYLFDIENFHNNIINIVIAFTCFSPFMLLAVLNRFLFGKILCVLAEDKLYYFSAVIRKNSRLNKTNGYLDYNEIETVEYISAWCDSGPSRISKVIISGENFELTIRNANRNLVREINKKR